MAEKPENIQKRFEASLEKSIKLIEEIYDNEALFLDNILAKKNNGETQKYSDRAHRAKDELFDHLDKFMSMRLNTRARSTRKRSRANNSARRLNYNGNIPAGQE
jgi:hypothetical protein